MHHIQYFDLLRVFESQYILLSHLLPLVRTAVLSCFYARPKTASVPLSDCEPLIETKHVMCKDVHQAHKKFLEDVEREKPDVLFISPK